MKVFGIIGLVFLLVMGCGKKGSVDNDPGTNNEDNFEDAVDFTINDVDDVPFSLSTFYGDVIVLNFFATWCAPCQIEMPQLESNIWQAYKDQGVKVIGVDLKEELGQVKLFQINNSLTFLIGIDESGDVFQSYAGGDGVTNVPFNVVIDQNMKIRMAQTGYSEEEMTGLIDELLTNN